MALDSNLYTLHFVRRVADPSTVDIVRIQLTRDRPAGEPPTDRTLTLQVEASSKYTSSPLYIRQRARKSPIYDTLLLDGLLDQPLASVSAPTSSLKSKLVKLHNPETSIELRKQNMTFSQEWRFEWERATYMWKREATFGPGGPGKNEYSCWAVRAPDPNIWISIYKPTTGGLKARGPVQDSSSGGLGTGVVEAFMQIMDHNISRIDPTVRDRKGLELVMLMSLSAILDQDFDEKYKTPAENMYLATNGYLGVGTLGSQANGEEDGKGKAPPEEVSSLLLMGRQRSFGASSDGAGESAPNEVHVEAWGEVSAYVEHCITLLKDDGPAPQPAQASSSSSGPSAHGQNLSIIILKATSADNAQKAVAIAAGVKAAFYKLPDSRKGKDAGEELFQYVRSEDLVDTSSSSSGKAAAPNKAPEIERRGGRPIIKLDPPKPTPSASSSGSHEKPTKNTHSSKPSLSSYIPPTSLTVYLSKERIAELEPKSQPPPRIPPKNLHAPSSSSTSGPNSSFAARPGHAYPPPAGGMPGFVPSGHGPSGAPMAQQPPQPMHRPQQPHQSSPSGAGLKDDSKDGLKGKLLGKLGLKHS
jgi:hypothetical protein